MRAGHLDAVVVYRSNVLSHAGNAAELDVIPIQMEAALAHQTYATARSSSQPLIVERLLAEIASAESREPFESLGFNFLGGTR
jgi:ABC-type molybdate transport system substrate-binding protein